MPLKELLAEIQAAPPYVAIEADAKTGGHTNTNQRPAIMGGSVEVSQLTKLPPIETLISSQLKVSLWSAQDWATALGKCKSSPRRPKNCGELSFTNCFDSAGKTVYGLGDYLCQILKARIGAFATKSKHTATLLVEHVQQIMMAGYQSQQPVTLYVSTDGPVQVDFFAAGAKPGKSTAWVLALSSGIALSSAGYHVDLETVVDAWQTTSAASEPPGYPATQWAYALMLELVGKPVAEQSFLSLAVIRAVTWRHDPLDTLELTLLAAEFVLLGTKHENGSWREFNNSTLEQFGLLCGKELLDDGDQLQAIINAFKQQFSSHGLEQNTVKLLREIISGVPITGGERRNPTEKRAKRVFAEVQSRGLVDVQAAGGQWPGTGQPEECLQPAWRARQHARELFVGGAPSCLRQHPRFARHPLPHPHHQRAHVRPGGQGPRGGRLGLGHFAHGAAGDPGGARRRYR